MSTPTVPPAARLALPFAANAALLTTAFDGVGNDAYHPGQLGYIGKALGLSGLVG